MLCRRTKICQDHIISAVEYAESVPCLVRIADTEIGTLFNQTLQCFALEGANARAAVLDSHTLTDGGSPRFVLHVHHNNSYLVAQLFQQAVPSDTKHHSQILSFSIWPLGGCSSFWRTAAGCLTARQTDRQTAPYDITHLHLCKVFNKQFLIYISCL